MFLAISDCLCFVQEESTAGHQSRLRAGLSWDSGVSGLSATSHIATQLEGEQLSDIQPELQQQQNYSHSAQASAELNIDMLGHLNKETAVLLIKSD